MEKRKRLQFAGFTNPIHSNGCPVVLIFINYKKEIFSVWPTGEIYQVEATLDDYNGVDNFTPASDFSPLRIFYERGMIGYIDMRGKLHLTTKASLRSLLRCDIPRICDEDHRSMAIEMLEKLG